MKKYALLMFFLLPISVDAVVVPSSNNAQEIGQVTVKEDDECTVCLETAKDRLQAKGPDILRRTDCCKKFLCADCERDLARANVKSCPNCRREAEFKTSPAVIEGLVVERRPNQAQEALLKAILNDSKVQLEQAIKDGADINMADTDGKTPVWAALLAGRYQLAIVLIESGAKTDKNYRNNTFAQAFFNVAVGQNQLDNAALELLALLVKNKVDFSGIKKDGQDFKSYILGLLSQDSRGRGYSPQRRDNIIRLIEALTNQGYKIIQEAWDSGMVDLYRNKQFVELCLKNGINLNAGVGKEKIPPIFIAVKADDTFALEVLLDAGADINMKANPSGDRLETPLAWASENAKTKSIAFLMQKGAKS